jgi:hypothetical protein
VNPRYNKQLMRFRIQGGLVACLSLSWALLGVVAPRTLSAQSSQRATAVSHPIDQATAKQGRVTASPLLSLDDGLTILGAALESRHHADSRFDCSHLIHAIYERAGYPYTYANSGDLYDGVDEFERVTRPQAGDLIVWRGHVGIVISGEQHTFFSALRSGRGVESYDAKYWQKRGRPHFFRYIKGAPTLSASNGTAGLKLTGLRSAGSRQPIAAVAGASDDADDPESPSVPQPVSDLSIPRVQVVNSSRPKPEDVTRALLPTYEAAAQALESRDVFKIPQTVIVFENLTVRKVQLKRDQGWAEIQIDRPASLLGANSGAKKRSERQHWGLVRKSQDSWEMALPPGAIYVSREAAVRILAHQLTALADSDPNGNRDRKVQLTGLLNALLSSQQADSRR